MGSGQGGGVSWGEGQGGVRWGGSGWGFRVDVNAMLGVGGDVGYGGCEPGWGFRVDVNAE